MVKKNSGLIIALLIGLIISLLYFWGINSQLELSLGYDSSFLLHTKSRPVDKIKIIGIDQKSLDFIGNYPWRRSLYAELLKYLGKNPRIVGFDIIMPEHSQYPEDDKLLSETLKKSIPVALPVSLEPDPQDPKHLSFVYPLYEFSENAKTVGLIHYFPDSDGITRKSPLSEQFKDKGGSINIFSYEVAKIFLGKYEIDLPDIIYCNFQGKEEVFETYSFYDVITKKVPASNFKDSVVFVGAMAEGLQDRISSPIGPMYGVIYHAQLTSNIINKDYMRPVPHAVNILLILLVSVLSYIIWKYFETINQIFLIIGSIAFLYLAHILLFSNNIWISIISIIMASSVTFVSLLLFSQLKIALALKSELDKLISNFERRSLHYNIGKGVMTDKPKVRHNTGKLISTVDSNTKNVSTLAEIGNTLTLERTFLETLLNNIKISIAVTDHNSQIILTNPIAEEFFGKSNLIGKRLVDIVDTLPDLKAELISVYSGEKKLPVNFDTERATSMYNIKLLNLEEEKQDSKVICLIENITDWHQMANKDGLTQLWNQRYFKEYLLKEINKSKRYKNPLSLIMMDVDHFKSFNDTYGHQTGDIVLKSIANVLSENARETDIPARYGGEEFGIILTMTDEEGAAIFAERVRKKIESLKMLDINGNPVRQVTSSLGVAVFCSGSVSDFIEMADQALYQCKENGRNCIIKYSHISKIKDGEVSESGFLLPGTIPVVENISEKDSTLNVI